jgi:uncharacterized protein with PQ loop repeat
MLASIRESWTAGRPAPLGPFDRVLAAFSIVALIATVPQAVEVWSASHPEGVSLISWVVYLAGACLWFVHGLRKGDRSIYLACLGWIALDGAIVLGILVRGR